MTKLRPMFFLSVPIAVALSNASIALAFAQAVPAAVSQEETDVQRITVTPAAADVPVDVASDRTHVMPVEGTSMKQDHPAELESAGAKGALAAAATGAAAASTGVSFYPADLGNPFNFVTIDTAKNHNVYINAPPSAWGNPARFLRDLSKSDFIHVTDQYVNTTDDDRYRVGKAAYVVYPNAPHTLTSADIFSILHATAGTFGTGYQEIYHLFIPPGTDVCNGTSCYSPDNPATFRFCAYHGAITFSDIGHVIYSVEPYQNVPGCAVSGALPNGAVVDSTASVLSHELFEIITDPDLNAWWDRDDLDLRGAEIGDVCQRSVFNYGTPLLHHRLYEIQPEYSNAAHACVFSPPAPE